MILPPNRDIIKGKDAISSYWSFGKDFKQLYHRTIADSIIITGNYAFDCGYWYSEAKRGNNSGPLYSGKYLIVWEKRNGLWKMYQDIWNNRSGDWKPQKP
jgi:ketosteroid isomerase-like protein